VAEADPLWLFPPINDDAGGGVVTIEAALALAIIPEVELVVVVVVVVIRLMDLL
jgi:hypothetical protein